MGYDASAMLIVGIEAERSDFEIAVKAPGCGCRKHRSKFCPECGAPAIIEKTEEIDGWNGDQFRDLELIAPGEPDSTGILGVKVGEVDAGEGYFPLEDQKAEIAEAFSRVAGAIVGTIFEARRIKTWIMLYESY